MVARRLLESHRMRISKVHVEGRGYRLLVLAAEQALSRPSFRVIFYEVDMAPFLLTLSSCSSGSSLS
jgi:hypothetical protein